ncbi:MAG: regulatory signaling modulator protein AmpE [Pseudomonadota bacterium]
MKILALFVALVLERMATHLFHWRELRWLDPLLDVFLVRSRSLSGVTPYLWVLLALGVAVAPVVIIRLLLDEAWLGLPYFVLSAVVLFLCLGPEDIGEEVDRWCAAVRSGDEEEERRNAKALLERRFTDRLEARTQVAGAVFAQANNRIFAVIFWFILLGPIGAWLFRVSDLARRRALFQAKRMEEREDVAADCEQRADDVHAVLAWIPARLSALGYLFAGNYDVGRAAWHNLETGDSLARHNERLLSEVGFAALNLTRSDDEPEVDWAIRAARCSKNLALRTLWFWLVGVAVLTIAGVAI